MTRSDNHPPLRIHQDSLPANQSADTATTSRHERRRRRVQTTAPESRPGSDIEEVVERLMEGTDAIINWRIDAGVAPTYKIDPESNDGIDQSGDSHAVDDEPIELDLSDKVEQILADAAAATEFDAAAVYLLDDETTSLKAVALHGLHPNRLDLAPRDLSQARADLEAFVKGHVLIDDLQDGLIDTWNCPESNFGAAIAVAILDGDYPLGTLWLYSHQSLTITPKESAAARMASDAIGTLLREEPGQTVSLFTGDEPDEDQADDTTEILENIDACNTVAQRRPRRTSASAEVLQIANWQIASLPSGNRIAEDWFVDGMIESGNDWAVGWHHWDILPDGRLALMMAETSDPSLSGTMTSTFARAAALSHLGYRHRPAEILGRINDTLWNVAVPDQSISVAYANMDVETGEGSLITAGHLNWLVASRHGYRTLAISDARPLGTNFDAVHPCHEFKLQRGEMLLGINPETVRVSCLDEIGRHMRDAFRTGGVSPLQELRRHQSAVPVNSERSAVSLFRR